MKAKAMRIMALAKPAQNIFSWRPAWANQKEATLGRAAMAITAEGAREALGRLNGLAPLEKARLVQGLFAAATADGEIRLAEAEVLRLVCAVLETPLPPLLERLSFSPASS